MANCVKCGESIGKGVKFCPSCGAAVGTAPKASKSSASKTAGKGEKQTAKSSASEIQNKDYEVFGGWLLFFYWGSIIGGVFLVIGLLLGLMGTITAAAAYRAASAYAEILGYSGYRAIGATYIISALVSIASSAVAMVFYIRAAIQMKARNSRFFDTYVMAAVISFGGSIISSLFTGIGSFIGSIIWGVIGFAIGISLVIMYFQKSVRVKVYFSGRPLHDSKYWDKIERLPDFITSEKPLW